MTTLPPIEMRKRLTAKLAAEIARAKAAKERPSFTVASLGRALGDKDYIRDFLAGRKESLSMEAIVECERLIGMPHGALHLAKPLVSSFDPDTPTNPHDAPDQPDVSHFPSDGIKELAAKGGMGAGEVATSINKLKSQGGWHADSYTDDYWRFPPAFIREELASKVSDLLVIVTKGDSMEPTLRAGDRVIANTFERTPTVDGLYAILNGVEEVVVKRLVIVGRDPPRLRIISDNPSTPPEEYAWDQVPIVGRIVAGLRLF